MYFKLKSHRRTILIGSDIIERNRKAPAENRSRPLF